MSLTTPYIADNIDAGSVEGDETEREEDAHREPGLVGCTGKLSDHGTL